MILFGNNLNITYMNPGIPLCVDSEPKCLLLGDSNGLHFKVEHFLTAFGLLVSPVEAYNKLVWVSETVEEAIENATKRWDERFLGTLKLCQGVYDQAGCVLDVSIDSLACK